MIRSSRFGAYRHEIQIQSATLTPDGQGGQSVSWSTITGGQRLASIQVIRGDESFRTQGLEHRVTHKLRTRHLSGVTTAHRVLFGSRAFDVRHVEIVDEVGHEIVMLVEERAAG